MHKTYAYIGTDIGRVQTQISIRYLKMRGARGVLEAMRKGARAALASFATLLTAFRIEDDRKKDLAAVEAAAVAISRRFEQLKARLSAVVV